MKHNICVYIYVCADTYIYIHVLVFLIACLLYKERASCSLVHLNMPNMTETRTHVFMNTVARRRFETSKEN